MRGRCSRYHTCSAFQSGIEPASAGRGRRIVRVEARAVSRWRIELPIETKVILFGLLPLALGIAAFLAWSARIRQWPFARRSGRIDG